MRVGDKTVAGRSSLKQNNVEKLIPNRNTIYSISLGSVSNYADSSVITLVVIPTPPPAELFEELLGEGNLRSDSTRLYKMQYHDAIILQETRQPTFENEPGQPRTFTSQARLLRRHAVVTQKSKHSGVAQGRLLMCATKEKFR